jgi:hypothetical protein
MAIRLSDVTPIAFTRLLSTLWIEVPMPSKWMSTCPPMMSMLAGVLPL